MYPLRVVNTSLIIRHYPSHLYCQKPLKKTTCKNMPASTNLWSENVKDGSWLGPRRTVPGMDRSGRVDLELIVLTEILNYSREFKCVQSLY